MKEEYELKQKELYSEVLLEGKVDIAGDGRCDSPGHSALYGITTLMELKNHRVISSKLVKVRPMYIAILFCYFMCIDILI